MPAEKTPERKVSGRLIASVILIAAIAVFVFENTDRTEIRFLIPRVRAPLFVALFVAALVGAAAGALMARRKDRQ